MQKLAIFLLLTVGLLACNQPDQEPEFLGISNLKVGKINGSKASLNGNAHFHNPNKNKLKLKYIDIVVEVEGKPTGTIKHELDTKVPAVADFFVPLEAQVDIGEAGLLDSIISFLGGKKVKVRYVGSLKVSRFGYPMTVPVDYTTEIKL